MKGKGILDRKGTDKNGSKAGEKESYFLLFFCLT